MLSLFLILVLWSLFGLFFGLLSWQYSGMIAGMLRDHSAYLLSKREAIRVRHALQAQFDRARIEAASQNLTTVRASTTPPPVAKTPKPRKKKAKVEPVPEPLVQLPDNAFYDQPRLE